MARPRDADQASKDLPFQFYDLVWRLDWKDSNFIFDVGRGPFQMRRNLIQKQNNNES
jgi:hypothetical protein